MLNVVNEHQVIKDTEKVVNQQNIVEKNNNEYKLVEPAKQFNNVAYTYEINDKFYKQGETAITYNNYINNVYDRINEILEKELEKHTNVKFTIVLTGLFKSQFHKDIGVGTFWSSDFNNASVIINKQSIKKAIDKCIKGLHKRIEDYTADGSGWVLETITKLEIHIVKYTPLKGSSYIELPYAIRCKQACVNVKNKDNKCFAYAVLSAIYPANRNNNPNDVRHYKKHLEELNMDGINYPVKIEDIKKFEKQNPAYGINVFILENENTIVPRLICKDTKRTIINLLLITKDTMRHYVWIKDFSRLMSSSVSKDEHTLYWCYNCLCHFTKPEVLMYHKNNGCYDNPCAKICLPSKKKAYIEYNEMMARRQLKAPFIIYADFEALTKKVKKSNKYQKHIGCSYGYKIVSDYKEFTKPYKSYRGRGAVKKFIEALLEEEKYIIEILETNKEMILSQEDNENFEKASDCHICGKELKEDKVRDHDHITGKYRGAAHTQCNLNYNYKNCKIPVVFHNLRGYDSHLIMQEIGKYSKNITVIPNTTEKYVSFSMNRLQFIDSMQFLCESLEKLVECLKLSKDRTLFSNLVDGFKEYSNELVDLLIEKGVYPYDYMNSWKKFDEPNLPPMSKFYSKLNDTNIEEKDYERAKKVYDLFKCKNIGEYHDLYLKTDVLLLADVFENFRNTCMKNYGLDPANFYTSPGLSWYAMLKKTGKRIELFNDKQVDMLNLFEKNKRGGVCMISKRHSKANNKFMKNFDPLLPITYIMYLDANNLYGWAMSQQLPIGNFKWERSPNCPISEIVDMIMKLDDNGKRGYYFEIDFDYPKHLHDLHNDYPLAPENIRGQYSPLMKKLAAEHGMKEDKSKKLIPNLCNKRKYGVHYRLLKFYLSHGLILKKVHRIVSFDQEAWLKPYIDFNTQMRAKANTEFEKNFFKLLINSIYGKCCENVRHRRDIKLCTTAKKAQRLFNKPKFKDFTIFKNDELIAVEMVKTQIKYDKPAYLGACILDLSKLLMYQFHYDHIKPMYGDKVNLLFTDTDSLCYEVQTKDIYDDMLKHKDLYDFSEYPENHKCYDVSNKKVIGKFKDEAKGCIITEFIGLRPKLYSFLIEGDEADMKKLKLKEENKKAKGVKGNVVKNKLTHNHYRKALFGSSKDDIIQQIEFNIIKSSNHIINSVSIKKIGLSCLDNKRHVCDNNIHTLAIGHYKIPLQLSKNIF